MPPLRTKTRTRPPDHTQTPRRTHRESAETTSSANRFPDAAGTWQMADSADHSVAGTPLGTLVADFGRCCPEDTGTGGQGPAAWEN